MKELIYFVFEITKIISLLLAVRYTFVNFAKLYRGEAISKENTLIMALGISVFIYLQFILNLSSK